MPINAVDQLRDDHEAARGLFASVADRLAEGDHGAENAFEELATLIGIHVQLEEDLFYPRLVQAMGAHLPRELLDRQEEEETDALALLENLEAMGVGHEDFPARFRQFRSMLERHFREDEDERLFPLVEERMSSDQLEALGDEMARLREELESEMGAVAG